MKLKGDFTEGFYRGFYGGFYRGGMKLTPIRVNLTFEGLRLTSNPRERLVFRLQCFHNQMTECYRSRYIYIYMEFTGMILRLGPWQFLAIYCNINEKCNSTY